MERDERSHYRQCNGEHQHIAQYRLDAEEGRLLLQGGIETVVGQLCRRFEAVSGREGVASDWLNRPAKSGLSIRIPSAKTCIPSVWL